jgi:serine/threonine protein kinase/Tol biopolymer transport system component
LLEVGDRVAGFQVEAFVARGGMAVVYRARELGLGRTVALKVMAPELSRDSKFRQRFVRESELAASMDHPNIIPIYAAGEQDQLLYLVMRYVPGDNLGTVLEDKRALSPREALPVFTQVAGALDAAHARGLVHRDVKPENILLAGEGDLALRHVYLSDFGLTRRLSALTVVTTAGHFLGTLQYVSPEQVSNQSIDHRADIYSLGCVIYEALAGEPPFVRDSQLLLLWAHLNDRPPLLSDRNSDLPRALDEVLQQALSKNPADRQHDCQTLLAELRLAIRLGEKKGLNQLSEPMPYDDATTSEAIGPSSASNSAQTAIAQRPYEPAYSGSRRPTDLRPFTPDSEPGKPAEVDLRTDGRSGSSKPRGWIFVPSIISLVLLIAIAGTLYLKERPTNDTSSTTGPSSPSPTPTVTPPVNQDLPRSAALAPTQLVVPMSFDEGKSYHLYLADVTDKAPGKKLTRGSSKNFQPVVSPDRQTIIYIRESGTDSSVKRSLMVMSADGKSKHYTISVPDLCNKQIYRPAWNPVDPTMLAVPCLSTANVTSLNLVRTNGTQIGAINIGHKADTEWRVGAAAFSPDGKRLVFSGGRRGAAAALFLSDAEPDAQPTTLTKKKSTIIDGYPVWSRDNKTVTFRRIFSDGTEDGNADIYQIKIDSNEDAEPLIESLGYDEEGPSLSPSGDQLAFKSNEPTGQIFRVWVAERNGKRPEVLWTEGKTELQGSPSWSSR